MCVFAAREPEVALSRSRTVICGCWLATIARGCRGPRHPAPQDIGGLTLGCVSTQPRHPNAQPISGPEEALGKDVSTSPGTARTTSPPPEDVGLASFGPSLQPPAESDSVSFPPRSQPHEASRSFRGGSDTGTSVLTCAQTTRGRRLALPQCQLAARAQEAPVEAGRGGTGAGLPRPGPDPCAGPGEAPLHLTSSSSSPPEVGVGRGGRRCETLALHPRSRPSLPREGGAGAMSSACRLLRCRGQEPFDLSFSFHHCYPKPKWRGSGGRAGQRLGTPWVCTGGPCAPPFCEVETSKYL